MKFTKIEDPDGNVYEVETDETLEKEGVPADAAVVGKENKKILELIANKMQLTPEFANSIDELNESGDTSKLYVLPDGCIYAFLSKTTDGYTNQIPLSIDTDGSIYNKVGYKEKARISSSGQEGNLTYTDDCTNPVFITGLISVIAGDILRFENCYIDTKEKENYSKYGQNGWSLRIAYYNNSKIYKASDTWTEPSDNIEAEVDGSGLCKKITISDQFVNNAYKYIRLCIAPTGAVADAIVTINEEITGNSESGVVREWKNTGCAFVPADYEKRIIKLERTVEHLSKALASDMAVYGIVDNENNVVMTGTLETGEYTLKYLNSDGTVSEIGTFEMG